jgi:hypothetical protein
MQLSVRSYLTAGVAALGATAIIAAPITPVPHHFALGAPSISTVTADVQFTSVLTDLATAINLVVDGFQGATDAAVDGVLSVASALSATTQTTFINTASIITQILSYASSGVASVVDGFVNAANVFLPSPFDQALSLVAGGFLGAGSLITVTLGTTLVNLVRDTFLTLNTTSLQLLNAAITSSRNAEVAVVDGFQNALTSAASFNFGQAISEVVGGFQAGAGFLAMGAQNAAAIVASTASTLFSYAQQFVQALVTYPVDAVQAAYQGIKSALALFGIPLPFAATKPTATVTAPAAAAISPARAAAAAEASSTTDEQAPTPRATKRTRDTGRRSVAPSTSAVQGQHDSDESSGSGQSEGKQSGAKDGSKHDTAGSRASRHNAA